MVDANGFIKDSLFCEYGYVINLDKNVLEFWVGFQHKPQEGNRYGTESIYDDKEYYPCKLLLELPFGELLDYEAEDVVKLMEEALMEEAQEKDYAEN